MSAYFSCRAPRGSLVAAVGRLALLALLVLIGVGEASAQPAPPTTPAASRGSSLAISIAGQPLGAALADWSRQTGLRLSFAPALVAGRSASAVTGPLSPREALDRLLAGSGLIAVDDSAGLVLREGERTAALDTVVVSGKALPGEPTRPYAGGQVARGGRFGLLGDQDAFETPFSSTTFTEQLLRDKQVTELRDIAILEPTLTLTAPRTYFGGGYSLRGFDTTLRFNGLKGLTNTDMLTDGYERIEIIKGPTALLNGGANGLGGVINLVPKRATDVPINRAEVRYQTQSVFGGAVDIGRRFGPDNMFGVRGNLAYGNGEAAVDDERKRNELAALAFDLRTDALRGSVDLFWQKNYSRAFQNFYNPPVAPVGEVDGPPDVSAGVNDKRAAPLNRKHYQSDWGAVVAAEYDIQPETTARVAYGRFAGRYVYVFPGFDRAASTPTVDAFDGFNGGSKSPNRSGEASLTHGFDTGPLRHRLSLAYTNTRFEFYGNDVPPVRYEVPVDRPELAPAIAFPSFHDHPVALQYRNQESSYGFADSVSPADDAWRIVFGLRRQKVDSTGFFTFGGLPASARDTSKTLGALAKVRPWLAVYANYAEGLEPGDRVPTLAEGGVNFENAGEPLPPYRTKQIEAGLKVDFKSFGATAAAFQLRRPSVIDTALGGDVFRRSVDGQQTNRGVEANVFGEPLRGLRFVGGLSYIQPKLGKTQSGANDGRNATGTPRWSSSFSADYDLPFISGLTATGAVTHRSKQFLDAGNRAWIRAFTTFDVGVRYAVKGEWTYGRAVVLHADVLNVFDKNYWANGSSASLGYGDPRIVKLAASVDF